MQLTAKKIISHTFVCRIIVSLKPKYGIQVVRSAIKLSPVHFIEAQLEPC